MASSKDVHGVGTDRGGGPKAMKKGRGAGGKGAAKKQSGSVGKNKPRGK